MNDGSDLPDAGPDPWQSGSGLTPEDMRDFGLKIFKMRVEGISLDDIAAHLGWSRARVAFVLARIADGIRHDLTAQGLPTDPNDLDRLARDAEWSEDGAE